MPHTDQLLRHSITHSWPATIYFITNCIYLRAPHHPQWHCDESRSNAPDARMNSSYRSKVSRGSDISRKNVLMTDVRTWMWKSLNMTFSGSERNATRMDKLYATSKAFSRSRPNCHLGQIYRCWAFSVSTVFISSTFANTSSRHDCKTCIPQPLALLQRNRISDSWAGPRMV